MPHIVRLNLMPVGGNDHQDDLVAVDPFAAVPGDHKLRKQDFRVHGGGQAHWLLRHPFGIDLLVSKLIAERPAMKVPRHRVPLDLFPLLDPMIDVLGMRAWPEPTTLRDRMRAGWLILRSGYCLGAGVPLPDWRSMYRRGSTELTSG